ncbi:MAG: ATP-NAD kinase family protein [Spirochaetales bacterium]|nr:ATP-NAD kinase family protein [Spirochaetales bacterium]
MKKKIGLIVNPIAGMGGSVGLKGTDGAAYEKALALGARPVTPVRTRELLNHLRDKERIRLFAAAGPMGEEHTRDIDIHCTVVGDVGTKSTAEDTKKIANEMLKQEIELLIFVGGDGTARDIYDAIGLNKPVVAVPAGVKVFSAVFALNCRAAARMVDAFLEGAPTVAEEVLDIDEEAFRDNELASRLYGYLLVPAVRDYLQRGKERSNISVSASEVKQRIASYIIRHMDRDALHLLGPGTTVKAITDALGLTKTLLGVDAVANGELVGSDINEEGILSLIAKYKESTIIVTPIGGNGFVFGRGNKQFTPEVIKRVGTENIIVVGTHDKLNGLQALRVDTGDAALDQALAGYREVVVGDNEFLKMEVLG